LLSKEQYQNIDTSVRMIEGSRHFTTDAICKHITTLSVIIIIIILKKIFWAHQHKDAGLKIRLSKNNDRDGVSHGVKCSQEGDCIPHLKSNR